MKRARGTRSGSGAGRGMGAALTAALLAAALLAPCDAAGSAVAVIRMADSVTVDDGVVRLADVASIDVADAARRERLGRLVVGTAGEGPAAVIIDAEAVRSALAAAGENPAAVTLAGAISARVTRAATGAAGDVGAAVSLYLRGREPESEFVVSELAPVWNGRAPSAPVVVGAHPRVESGIIRFDVADASDIATVAGHVHARVSKTMATVVTRRRISSGRTLSPEDVEVRYVPEAEAAGAARSLAAVLGRRVLYTLAPGTPVSDSYIKSETLVKRGDQVTLAIESGAMIVSIRTTALENAALGDAVRLRRIGTSHEYLAKVVGAGSAVPANGGQE